MSLKSNFLGLDAKNPLMPASGPSVRDTKACIDCIKGGCGLMVTKTISTKAAKSPTPNMYENRIHKNFLSSELWSEFSPEKWIKYEYPKIREACTQSKIPLICSIGYTAEEVAELAPKVAPFADAVELSTQHLGGDVKSLQEAVKAAVEGLKGKPVIVKLSPLRDVEKSAKAAVAAGASALTCIDSFGPCLAVDIERGGAPFLGGESKYGYISGPGLKPLGVRAVYEAAKAVGPSVPIIGVGGITDAKDAIEYLMCGASGLGIGTAAIVKGRDIFGLVAKEMTEWLHSHGYTKYQDVIGLALKHDQIHQYKAPKIDTQKCVGCGQCVTSCLYGAMKIGEDGYVICDNDKCFRCGLCYPRCPTKAISIQG